MESASRQPHKSTSLAIAKPLRHRDFLDAMERQFDLLGRFLEFLLEVALSIHDLAGLAEGIAEKTSDDRTPPSCLLIRCHS